LVLSTKRLVAAANFLVAATKILFVVPNFVAVTKAFFSMREIKHFQAQNNYRKKIAYEREKKSVVFS